MAQKDEAAAGEEESIKPVSFLLSHFENLASSKQATQSPDTSDTSSRHLKAPTAAENTVLGRASLDLPRPDSEWCSSRVSSRNYLTIGRTSPRPAHKDGCSEPPSRPRNPRPLSMFINSTSSRNPLSAVESPRPSPRTFGVSSPRINGRRTEHQPALGTSPSPTPPPLDRPHITSRNLTAPTDVQNGKAPKTASIPPPVNRAEKPKFLTAKPPTATTLATNSNSLAPSSQRTSFEDRVSPFSTPPSSPEKQTPPTLSRNQPSRHSPSPSRVIDSAIRRPHLEPNPSQPAFKSQPAQTEAPAFSRQTKPPSASSWPSTQPPPPPPASRRNGAAVPSESGGPRSPPKQDDSDERVDRPGLRSRLRIPSGRTATSLKADAESTAAPPLRSPYFPPPGTPRQTSQFNSADPRAPLPPPPPRREVSSNAGRPLYDQTTQVPLTSRSPMRSEEISSTSPAAVQQHLSKIAYEEPSDRRPSPDDTPISRTDYPDASHTNRRPPFFRGGTREIHTKNDTRVFDVCGQYVCATGFFSRAWDIVSGELVMSLSHGESTKGVSIAFKPGRTLDEEGKSVWIGTNTGELLEVDITTQSVVASRSSPSRREIIKIYRHKRELWTLDDEGRLLVWPPDESGCPNFQHSYSNPYDRVARGHTFSMIVGDTLWYATGKEVRIYQPNANDSSFQVLKAPLGKNHSGDVSCGTATRDLSRVYLGHADGKVTIYSTRNYSYLGTVNVSLYKISALAVVGDYLWAGYKTGMIYVYDTTTNPWTVKKDWLAHDQGVCGLIPDPSGIWTVNRFQVLSLGVDNYIRPWDGMLEDDWLESRMQSRDVEYCQFREITAAVVTWNAGATVPSTLRDNEFIREAIHTEDPPDLLIFGFQELVSLEDKKITAKSFLKSSKKKDHADVEHMSRQYRVWRDHLASCIHEFMPLDQPYVLLHTASLIGLFTCVFVKQKERHRIRNVNAAEVKRGMGGLHGNKGALILRFIIDDSSVCLINCHLAAGQTQTAHRNNDIAGILESEALPMEPSAGLRIDRYVGGGDGSMILDNEICILNGDLNYRIDSMPRNTVLEAIKAGNLPKLLDRDQLLASRRKNPSFRLRAFNEMPITFAPTYKYDVGTDNYDSSEKKRSPAWCDRLLYRGVGRIKQVEYRRHEVRVSDHRPVSGLFKMRVKTIDPERRTTVWESCQQEFVKEKRRLATSASVDYLVRGVGLSPQEAQSLISA